jgi:hypothetical protein
MTPTGQSIPSARGGMLALLRSKAVVTTVKLMLAAGLLYWVCSTINWQETGQTLKALNWWWFVLGLALQWAVIFIANHRLQILLRAQGVVLGYLRLLNYVTIGLFFNVMLPGGAGGDVLKIYYVAREAPRKKPEIITAILLDRCMGLTAVVTIAACALLASVRATPELSPLVAPAVLALAALVVGTVLVATREFWQRYAWWRWCENRMPGFLLAMVNALHKYRSHKMVAITALADSFALQLLMCLIAYCFGTGLHLSLPWHKYFVVFPIIAFVMNIPITPGGLGITEYAAQKLFPIMGASSAGGFAFMILLRLNVYLAGVPGIVLYLLPRARVTRAQLDAESQEIAHMREELDSRI